MTSVGEEVHSSSWRTISTPRTIRAVPLARARVMAVWTLRPTLSYRPAPRSRDTTTLVPTDKPTNRLMSRFISAVLDPTAARASLPANQPTTTTSAALNSSWSRLEAISGRAKNRSLSASDPLHMSMLWLFFTISNSPLYWHIRFNSLNILLREKHSSPVKK